MTVLPPTKSRRRGRPYSNCIHVLVKMQAYLDQIVQDNIKRAWPKGMTEKERKEPHASFEHYRPFFMMFMSTHWLPQVMQKRQPVKVCKGSSQFVLEAQLQATGEVALRPPVSIFDAVYEGCEQSFLLPTLVVREQGRSHAIATSLVMNPIQKQTEFSFVALWGENEERWLQSLLDSLTAYFKESILVDRYKVVRMGSGNIKLMGTGLHGTYHMLHDVLKMLEPGSDIHLLLEQKGRSLRSVLDSFIKQAWITVSNIGLLKKGAPFSLKNTASYEQELEELEDQLTEDTSSARKQRLRAQYWKLVKERQKVQDWALSLVTEGLPMVEDLPDSAASVVPDAGEPGQPISPLRSPVEFLNQLLSQAKEGCHWPSNMSAKDLEDPYLAFTFYRPYYLRYMLQTELPKLGYMSGCHLKQEPVTVSILFRDKEEYQQLSVWAHPDLDSTIRMLLQQNKNCSLLVMRLEWKIMYSLIGHEMSLVIDLDKQTIEYMEPNGPEDADWIDAVVDALESFFQKSQLFRTFKILPPFQVCPIRIQFKPHCAHYSILYDWLRIACSHCEANAIADAFSKYDKESNELIIEAFTCHMWRKMGDIGLLDQFRDQPYPLSYDNFLERTGRHSFASLDVIQKQQEYDKALQEWINKRLRVA